jgi:hypothetical protein
MPAAANTYTFRRLGLAHCLSGTNQNMGGTIDMDFITTLQGLDWTSLLEIGLQLVGTFALIAAMTKNSSDNVIADFLLRVVNTLGGNIGRARNG